MASIAHGPEDSLQETANAADLDTDRLPHHVAIIMDGNGRWAERRGLDRAVGHREGARAVRAVVTRARELGLRYLTLFAFSTENWARPSEEVEHLMGLLVEFCREEQQLMLDKGIRMRVIGERERLADVPRAAIEEVERLTAANDEMELVVAVSYGAREEILRATRQIAREVRAGELVAESIDGALFGRYLWTAGMPDPDLLIRTSGELRVSNFLLWQIAYAELYVEPCLWPDFREEAFERALAAYGARQRRFGRLHP